MGTGAIYGEGLWGEAVWGEVVWGEGEGALTSLLIDSVEYIGSCLVIGTTISKGTDGAVHTMAFTLSLPTGAPAVNVGSLVECSTVDGLMFSGYISRMEAIITGSRTHNNWAVTCQDHMRLLDSTAVGLEVFSGTTDQEIIQQLFATYLPSVTTSNVQAVVTIANIDLSFLSLRACMEKIKERSQAVWYLNPGLALYCHEAGERIAPFGLMEDADELSAWPILRTLAYSEEFSAPCNKATVANMLAEAFTLASYNPPATGDDGQIARASTTTEYPPTGAYTAETAGNTMTARRQKTNPTSGQITPSCSGAEDGHVSRVGTSWPPAGDLYVYTDSKVTLEASKYADDVWWLSTGLMFFNTSAIPDTAEITSAVLSIGIDSYEEDGASFAGLGVGWYSGSNRPIDASDWTSTPSSSAYGYVHLHDVGAALTLKSPNSYISKTGYTGLRLHCRIPGGSPQGINWLKLNVGSTLTVTYLTGGGSYVVTCALVRFDTSALPDTAVVSGATLKLKIAALANADAAQISVEWYAGTNWPIGNAGWTNTPAATAYALRLLSGLPAVGQWWNIPLLIPATGVTLTAYTGLRVHITVSGTPTGDNSVSFSTQETANDPVLEVTYVPGAMISQTAENSASQAAYGVFEKRTIDATITSAADALQLAQAEVLRGAWPAQVFSGTVAKYGLDIGQMVQIDVPTIGLSESLLIRSLSMTTVKQRTWRYTIEAGDVRVDLIKFLRKLAS